MRVDVLKNSPRRGSDTTGMAADIYIGPLFHELPYFVLFVTESMESEPAFLFLWCFQCPTPPPYPH